MIVFMGESRGICCEGRGGEGTIGDMLLINKGVILDHALGGGLARRVE